jgi:hypothetical protein
VLRLVKYVALSNAHVHAYVTSHSERTMFEDIPLPLLRRVAFTLLPPPLPPDQQGSRLMSPAPTVVVGVPSSMSTLSSSTGERCVVELASHGHVRGSSSQINSDQFSLLSSMF